MTKMTNMNKPLNSQETPLTYELLGVYCGDLTENDHVLTVSYCIVYQ